jgi:hypothetical protein
MASKLSAGSTGSESWHNNLIFAAKSLLDGRSPWRLKSFAAIKTGPESTYRGRSLQRGEHSK